MPEIQGYRGLIDKDTPESVLKRTGFDGQEYSLVFSDEFEQDGRTFWPGDDPYWTAVDTHYCESLSDLSFQKFKRLYTNSLFCV